MKKQMVFLYSLIHFIVDLSCAILVTNFVSIKMGEDINYFFAVIIYNFCAFAMELPIGVIADKVNKNALCSSVGCLLVAASFGLANFGIVSCLIAGLGNGMFHVGGGIDVLNISDKKATLSRNFCFNWSNGNIFRWKISFMGIY